MKHGNWTRISLLILAPVVAAAVYAGTASASTSTGTSTTPAVKTCAAFARWNAHRTTANLNAMMTVSEAAPWLTAGRDAYVLYGDVRGLSWLAPQNTTRDARAFVKDCR